jgi:hypothetical protein
MDFDAIRRKDDAEMQAYREKGAAGRAKLNDLVCYIRKNLARSCEIKEHANGYLVTRNGSPFVDEILYFGYVAALDSGPMSLGGYVTHPGSGGMHYEKLAEAVVLTLHARKALRDPR